MILLIVYIIAFLLFLFAPLPFQILFMLANIFIPDPIPVIDEALMLASIVKKIIGGFKALGIILDFKEKHPILFRIIIVSIGVILVMLIKKLLS